MNSPYSESLNLYPVTVTPSEIGSAGSFSLEVQLRLNS